MQGLTGGSSYGPGPVMDLIASSVLAKYREKRRLENGSTIYLYTKRQVANRNRKKALRLEKLRKNIGRLRAQVRRDLQSEDPELALTALAIGLIDATAERVGSPASAAGDLNEKGDPHFGVTQWQREHVSFGKGGATIRYVGKSGVRHTKRVTDQAIVTALRRAHDGADNCIFEHDTGRIGGPQVNAYLRAFKITAKDLRGWHANDQMRTKLKAIRAKGGKLPEDKTERLAKLKKEWKLALKRTAREVGHEPETLAGDYLTSGLEEGYLKDGTVPDRMAKRANQQRIQLSSDRVLRRFLAGAVPTLNPELATHYQDVQWAIADVLDAAYAEYLPSRGRSSG